MKALLLLLAFPTLLLAQPVIETKPIRFSAEVGTFGVPGQRTPFWLRANQYGVVPNQMPYATFRGAMQRDYQYYPLADRYAKRKDFFGFGYGAELVGNVGTAPGLPMLLPEAYVKGRAGSVELIAGRRRELVGLADSTIGSGSYIWSGNTMPLPKIQLGLPQYTPIGFTRGILSFRGMYAHGWFENSRLIQHAYLHQKALYARICKPNWPVKLYAGANHQVQWGGVTTRLSENLVKNGRFPTRFKDYADVVTGKSLGYDTNVDTTRYSIFDRQNRLGNHLGTVDVGMEIETRHFSLFLYRQSIYEDGSLFYLSNIADGLHGIRFRNLNRTTSGRATSGIRLKDVLVEFLYTKSQGGALFTADSHFRGRDNYFNHSQFQDGWSYFGRTIGTPFIPPTPDTQTGLPRYGFSNDNRVRVFHVGLSGFFAHNGQFQLKGSFSQNYGTYDAPFPKEVRQVSAFLKLDWPLDERGLLVTLTAATDRGQLYDNSTGVYVGLRKTWDYVKYRLRP